MTGEYGTEASDADAEDGEGGLPLDRRTVMQGAAAGGAAALGLTAASGNAAAVHNCTGGLGFVSPPSDFPVVVADGNDILGGGGPSFTEQGSIPSGEDEVVIYVHGFLEALTGGPAAQGATLQQALEDAGYDHPVISYKYASNNPVWWVQTGSAEDQGRAFATWIENYRASNPDTTIRLVGHSLGARTSLGCVDELVNVQGNEPVASVGLLGGAIAQNAVTTDGEFGTAVANGANQVNNYYSTNDAVLGYIFTLGEAGTTAVGAQGAPDGASTPSNYADHDVSSKVGGHCEYMMPDSGVGEDLAKHFDTSPGTGGTTSGSGGSWFEDLFGW